MALKINDKIEVQKNSLWRPYVVERIHADGNYFDAKSEAQPMSIATVMMINEWTVWRHR